MQVPDGSPRSSSFSPFDDSVAQSSNLLPASLRDGGLSAVSSRRPSYAAEFATRPRLIETLGPENTPALGIVGVGIGISGSSRVTAQGGGGSPIAHGPELPRLGTTVSNPTIHPLIDTDRWLSQLGRAPAVGTGPNWSLWNVGATGNGGPGGGGDRGDDQSRITSSPAIGTVEPSVVPGTPGSGGSASRSDFVIPVSPGQKKNYRSLSFPHAGIAGGSSANGMNGSNGGGGDGGGGGLGGNRPHLLDTFAEEDYEEQLSQSAAQVSMTGPSSSMAPPPMQQHIAPIGQNSLFWMVPGSRRHSYAGEQHINETRQGTTTTTTTTTTINTSSTDQSTGTNTNWTITTRDTSDDASGDSSRNLAQPVSSKTGTGSSQQSGDGEARPNSGGAVMDKQLELHIDRYFSFDRKGSSTTSDQHHPPLSSSEAAALISVPSRKLYFVQFKGGRLDVFFIPENSNLTVLVNDLVIVDADRGRDLGRVVKDHVTLEEAGMLKYRRHQEQKAILQHNPNAASGSASGSTPPVTMPKQILRYAQLSEIHQIITKEANEDKAVAMCMHKVEEKGLNMSVIDAEYQWDGRKLTFFYSASHRIDFRDLVRELFRIYKTRIWMCAVNSSADAPLPLPPTPVVSSGASHQTASPSTSTLQSADSSDHDTAASPQLQNPHYEYGIVASQLLGGPPRPQQRPFYRMAEGWGPMMPPIPPPTGAYNPASGVPMFPQQAPPPGPGVAPPRKITGGHPPPSYGYPTFPQPFAQPQSEQAATSGQYWYGMPPPSQPFY